jgi:phage tail sheath protein FI
MALYTASESPAIITREVDLTNGVPNVPTSTGAFVGDFRWGPVNEPVLVNNEATLANKFGNPDADRAIDFLSASSYLQYSDDLYIVRAITTSTATGGAQIPAVLTSTLDGNGVVTAVAVAPNGGYTSEPTVTISTPDSGVTPTLTVTYDSANDEIDAITVSGSGYRYDTDPVFTITGGGRETVAVNAYDATNTPETLPVVQNADGWDADKAGHAANNHITIAKWPGELGNSLKVCYCGANDSDFANWKYTTTSGTEVKLNSYFDGAPGTSNFAQERGASNDEVHVIVIDEDGEFSGVPNRVLETFSYLSLASNAKTTQGTGNYAPDVIARSSNYIWIAAMPAALGSNAGTTAANGKNYAGSGVLTHSVSLVNGSNSGPLGSGEYDTGFATVNDPNGTAVDFLIAPGMSSASDQQTVVNNMVVIAENTRKDCVVVASPNRAAVVGNATPRASIITAQDTNNFTRSSYLFADANYLKVYDKFNDSYVFIPAAASTAGIMAASDNNQAPWFSPAGTRRGRYFGVTSLSFNPDKSDRDELYKAGYNPIANLPGQGITLFGDKTHLSRPSAFDRINVRRLFLTLEKAISSAAQNILFEFNDEFTRAEFVNIVEPVLRNVQGRRGITDFKLVCDETNNTAEIIDTNQFIANIFIKPARSINFITLNFVAVRSGVSFEEVVGAV